MIGSAIDKIHRILDLLSEIGIPGYALSIRLHGEEIWRSHGGYSDYEKKNPTSGRELYNLYSCSKPITCVTAMHLLERGGFSLEDKVSDYLPEFADVTVRDGTVCRPAIGDIRIHHLFTMTGGLTYDLNTPNLREARAATEGKCPTREVMRYLARDPLAFDPGETYRYSLCHDVLAALVEVCADMPFNDYVTKHIFSPLGMTHSTYLPTEETEASLAAQYVYSPEAKQYKPLTGNVYRLGRAYASGGAGCVSTLDDYGKFLEALRRGGTLLREETLNLMTKNRLTPRQLTQFDNARLGYGYGLGVRCALDGSASTDFGWGGAAGAYVGCDRENDFTFVYLQHVLSMPNPNLRRMIPFYLREALGTR